ncbi:hypothetical protein NL676_003462 [Syzygium grande]|nr:hypothetical protein NL676_003462 [Syzygium grande]
MSLSKIEKAWSTYAISPGRKQNENPAFGLELNQRLRRLSRRIGRRLAEIDGKVGIDRAGGKWSESKREDRSFPDGRGGAWEARKTMAELEGGRQKFTVQREEAKGRGGGGSGARSKKPGPA